MDDQEPTSSGDPLPENSIRYWRDLKNMTLEDLAAAVGMDFSSISRIERGEQNCTISVLARIAKALERTVRELFSPPPGPVDPGKEAWDRLYAAASPELQKQSLRVLNALAQPDADNKVG